MDIDAINTYQVLEWLWSSGQLSERDISQLPLIGIDAVINLALPTSSNVLPSEAERITNLGISYFQIPVLWEQPKLAQLILFFDILDALKGQRVWVHCVKNMRVSAFIYLYRRLRLADADPVAVYPMKEIWQANDTWQSFINEALQMR